MDTEKEALQEARAFLNGLVQDFNRFNPAEQNLIVAGFLEHVRVARAEKAAKAQAEFKKIEDSYSELNRIIEQNLNPVGAKNPKA